MVGQHEDHLARRRGLAARVCAQSGCVDTAGRGAGVNPVVVEQCSAALYRIPFRDHLYAIDCREFEQGGLARRPDSGETPRGGETTKYDRSLKVDGEYLDRGVVLLHTAGEAGDGSGGANGNYDRVEVGRVSHNLATEGFVERHGCPEVRVLVKVERAVATDEGSDQVEPKAQVGLGDFVDPVGEAPKLRPDERRCIGIYHGQKANAQSVAEPRRCQPEAPGTGRGHRTVAVDLALRYCLADDVVGRSVLHGAGGVLPFNLREQRQFAGLVAVWAQMLERRLAEGVAEFTHARKEREILKHLCFSSI